MEAKVVVSAIEALGSKAVPCPSYAGYASAKGAIEVLTRYRAKELGQDKLR
ncbi:hypothetical protein NDI45_16550 [Leptolyngbya sp. GB1-A1]